jgi:hypothetical protein
MTSATSLRTLALGAALLFTVPTTALAQAELQTWLNPTLGKLMLRSDYKFTYVPGEPVEGQGTDLRILEHSFSLVLPLFQTTTDEWSLSGKVRLEDIDTRAILPDTGSRFPGELWDVRVGASYRHRFDNGWTAGASVTVGSASDKPFASLDEMIVRAVGMVRVPQGDRNAWLFSLIYASDQDFLGGVPIPGIAYLYSPSDRFTAVIGFPFSSIEWKPIEGLTLDAEYFPLRRVRARVTYQILPPLRIYAGFDWDNDHYYRADRQNKGDQLFYYEKRLTVGARFDLRHVGVELSGGYLFDRFFFEGEGYSDRHDNRLDVGSGPFVAAKVSVRF